MKPIKFTYLILALLYCLPAQAQINLVSVPSFVSSNPTRYYNTS